MLISFAYRLARTILGAVTTLTRRDVSRDAELLVLRHENTVLRRHVTKVCYRTHDQLRFAALCALSPRRRWAEVLRRHIAAVRYECALCSARCCGSRRASRAARFHSP